MVSCAFTISGKSSFFLILRKAYLLAYIVNCMIKCFALASVSYVSCDHAFVNAARDTINAFLLYMRLEIKDKSETDIYHDKFRNMHFIACYTT